MEIARGIRTVAFEEFTLKYSIIVKLMISIPRLKLDMNRGTPIFETYF